MPEPGAGGRGLPSEWETVGELPGALHVYRLAEGSAGALYAAALAAPLDDPQGLVYRSTDHGQSWTSTGPLPDAMAAQSLLALGDTLLTGTYPNGDVYRSTDGGLTWAATAEMPGVTAVRALLRTQDGAIIAGTSPDSAKVFRVFKTTDLGDTWTRLGDVPRSTGSVNEIFETPDGILFAGGRHISLQNHALISVSTDGGANWSTHQLPVEDDNLSKLIYLSVMWRV